MTNIFSEYEKQNIIDEVRTKYQYRSQVDFNSFVEVIAGLRIINKILGKNWYQRARNEIFNSNNPNSQKEHPISHYLTFKQPEKMVKLLNFANFLRNLFGKSNLEQRIQDYVRKEKRSAITIETFDKLYAELKIANYFIEKEFKIKFLKERKSKKTPDLQVIAADGSAVIECKRKKEQDDIIIESIIDSILDANSQLKNSEIPGIIFVDIPLRPTGPKAVKKFKATRLDSAYPQLKTVHYILLAGEWSLTQPGRAYTNSHMFSFENKFSELKLSLSLENVMLNITHLPQRSLLED